ncbi:fructosamine kinase family protein [Marinicella litoralis]|uniref:Fructosamine-3-kinase n=1 Tax=Marinicella litoralis TaxID=644220 RepID=A0A4R6XT37_9GAMM|nr:fructosamine kinase family protein [Marinicella litoralis]TDR20593.1 fructosamine-3-kinase [Marinicella litoralis]
MKFSKSNPTGDPKALIKEADALRCLQNKLSINHLPIKIPQIYSVNERCLQLEHINQMAGSKSLWQLFGRALAQMHLVPEPSFGWHEDNFIGLNPQVNRTTDNWGEFYVHNRLAHQISLIKSPSLQQQFKQSLSKLENQLIALLNENDPFPSLLHGDLWSGNVLFDEHHVWLVDPAIYCGDSEADLAMTELFGGFPAVFYQAYAEAKPLSKHYPLKKTIYNLYHQLNHYNLFGSGYLTGCERGFNTITQTMNL